MLRVDALSRWPLEWVTGLQPARWTALHARDVHVVLALRCAMMPESAFWANLFLPPVARVQVGALLTRPELAPAAPPRTWSLSLA